jgi:hypothetical protein
MLFAARKKNTTVISIDEMLSYRNTFQNKPAPDFDFATILKDARASKVVVPAALPTSENGYKVVDAATLAKGEKTVRAIQSILNKLTEKNYRELSAKVLELEMLEDKVIDEVVSRIYDKALDEPTFSPWYAQLCFDISKYAFDCATNKLPSSIDGDSLRRSVVYRAQSTFDSMAHTECQDDAELNKLRKRKLANIKFVGELFLRKLLKKSIMMSIVQEIFRTGDVDPQPPSQIDAEVGLEFLNVVGKELEAQNMNLSRVLEVISIHMASGAFGKRLTFLYQNLLELQASGWIRKEEPPVAETTAPPPPPPPPAQLSGKHSSSAMTSSASLSNLDKAAVSAESKMVALALPPDSFDEKHARKVVSAIRDTLLDGKWENTNTEYSTVLPNEPPHASRAACFYGIMTQICTSTKDIDRKDLTSGLANSFWDPVEVCRGVAWALTSAIVNRTVEDCPKFYSRFVEALAGPLALTHINILTAVKDVFARTANYLDALYGPYEGFSQWDLEFVEIWEAYVKQCVELGKDIPAIGDVLASLGSVRQTPFMQGILADFVQAMISANLCTKAEIDEWQRQHATNNKMKELVQQLNAMILF